ncbi:hypothetical protein HOLleu_00971 [Holothuria leucospilota]|uniref:Uncharacterized protein n=1 Tax=Holothuria leucospilota TaxID=206669 RepID=A0A9Q1HIZ8_HOLLE|nr:hypothetical protein HOLleu_00971 [Holothuria leucospilota]
MASKFTVVLLLYVMVFMNRAKAIASSRNSDVLLPSLHIGLNDNAREGDFVWSNGNKLTDAPNVVNWEPKFKVKDEDESKFEI